MPETTSTDVTADMPVGRMLKAAGKKLLTSLLNELTSKGTLVAAGGVVLDLLTSGKPGMVTVMAVIGKLLARGLADHGKNAAPAAGPPAT